MVTMKVFGLALDEDSQVPVLILKDLDEKVVLPIWIGAMEAMAISLALNGVKLPRPMTHDLLLLTIQNLDAKVLAVDVVELRDGTYYAEVEVEQHGQRKRIDCRPSDGIALALRAEAPISVAQTVLDQAASDNDDMEARKSGEPLTPGSDPEKWQEMLEKLDSDTKYKM